MTPEAIGAALMLAVLSSAAAAGLMKPRATDRSPKFPWATLAMAGAVAAMFAAQTTWPNLLPALTRTPALLHGELWRAGTALFVQDGGNAGTAFNLTALIIVGVIAELRLGPARWLTIYIAGGVVTEFMAMAWQPQGAGNSIACFALTGALASDFAPDRNTIASRLAAAIALAGGLALLALKNIHGIGFWTGAVLAPALRWRDLGRERREAR